MSGPAHESDCHKRKEGAGEEATDSQEAGVKANIANKQRASTSEGGTTTCEKEDGVDSDVDSDRTRA